MLQEKVYLLLDNLPAHFTQRTKDFLLLHPKFVVLRLPTYSPELNPIERLFLDLDRQTIHNHSYSSTEELKGRISAWLSEGMQQPVTALKPVSPHKRKRRLRKKVVQWN